MGIPATDIAFIQDYDADNAKLALFRSVRAGKVRILFGSTQKMGSGTNVQERLIALHHLDAPWRPADVEQREGRILRQGNKNSSVQIYRYVTEGSFDAYMWQTLETKAKFIAQVMSGDMTVRRLEDTQAEPARASARFAGRWPGPPDLPAGRAVCHDPTAQTPEAQSPSAGRIPTAPSAADTDAIPPAPPPV